MALRGRPLSWSTSKATSPRLFPGARSPPPPSKTGPATTMAAVLIALVSSLAGGFVGAGLESIKTANSEGLEVTRRRIDRSSEVYDRASKRYDAVDAMEKPIAIALWKWFNASGQEEMNAARELDALMPQLATATPVEIYPTYDVWVEPSLRGPLETLEGTITDYEVAELSRWPCDRQEWGLALDRSSPLGGGVLKYFFPPVER